jgi:hypothetical protein
VFELPGADLVREGLGLVIYEARDAVVEHGRHAEQRACKRTADSNEFSTTTASS